MKTMLSYHERLINPDFITSLLTNRRRQVILTIRHCSNCSLVQNAFVVYSVARFATEENSINAFLLKAFVYPLVCFAALLAIDVSIMTRIHTDYPFDLQLVE